MCVCVWLDTGARLFGLCLQRTDSQKCLKCSPVWNFGKQEFCISMRCDKHLDKVPAALEHSTGRRCCFNLFKRESDQMLVLCSLLILFLLLIVLCCCCSCCVNFPLVAFYFVIFYFVAAFLAALQTATAPDFVEFRARLNACLPAWLPGWLPCNYLLMLCLCPAAVAVGVVVIIVRHIASLARLVAI